MIGRSMIGIFQPTLQTQPIFFQVSKYQTKDKGWLEKITLMDSTNAQAFKKNLRKDLKIKQSFRPTVFFHGNILFGSNSFFSPYLVDSIFDLLTELGWDKRERLKCSGAKQSPRQILSLSLSFLFLFLFLFLFCLCLLFFVRRLL